MQVHRLLFSFALAALTLQAQTNFSGIWKIDIDMGDGTHQARFLDLKQDGNSVTGRVVHDFNGHKIRDGRATGDKLRFEVNTWRDVIETYDGTLQGGKLQLTMTVNKTPNSHGGTKTAVAARDSGEGMNPPPPLSVPKLHAVADNGLVRTPPMGWNSWNHFAGKVNDKVVRESADALVSSGMKDAGYIYVNIDDTWESNTRDAQGNIHTNEKFPDMKALADYVHSKGLKIGIYSGPGPYTCGGYLGSYGHEAQDAKTYAEWGFDYLKYDWCSAGAIYKNDDLQPVYQKMGAALAASAHPIVFSLCEYGNGDVWKWGPEVGGNLWRTTGDIGDSWQSMEEIGFKQIDIAQYARPGHWNDPDMLEVGNGGMTTSEYQVHMTLWSLLSAPLLAGNDLENMSQDTKDILMNREVIAIDQDPAVKHPKRTVLEGKTEVWTREMQDGSTVVALFNREEEPKKLSVTWSNLGLTSPGKARDLWKHEDVSLSGDDYSAIVPKHGVVLLRLGKS